VDLDAGTMSFSHNGSFRGPFGTAFTGLKLPEGTALRPTVSGKASLSAEFLFSAGVQAYSPPDASYRPVSEALPSFQQRQLAEAEGSLALAAASGAGVADAAAASSAASTAAEASLAEAEAADAIMDAAKAEAGAAAGTLVAMPGHEECLFVDETRLVYLQELPTARLAGCALTRGKWCFSVRVLQAGAGTFVGWARQGFAASPSGSGAGHDEHSWAVDGDSRLKWHANSSEPTALGWSSGDVVGCAIDLDQGSIFYGVNGTWAEAAFTGVKATDVDGSPSGFFPVVTLRASGVDVVIGGGGSYTISSTGPDGTFAPVGSAF
jgi:hypothetical protein